MILHCTVLAVAVPSVVLTHCVELTMEHCIVSLRYLIFLHWVIVVTVCGW